MSRRCHHGSARHAHAPVRAPRRAVPLTPNTAGFGAPAQPLPDPPIPLEPVVVTDAPVAPPALATPPLTVPGPRPAANGHAPIAHAPVAPAPNGHPTNGHAGPHHDDEAADRGATGPQLRRFIKSRAYVPMHELRRRFVINGGDDDVTPVDLGERRRVFVGLPEREGRLLGELLRGGDIGYELSLDPISPIVVGVYPMRPVTRA